MSGVSEQPYIGARVTLISSLDVRYEGTLFTIDPNESTVALQNVTCNGTEGRQSGAKAIPASDTVYEFIIFRGENIKSINIAESNKPPSNELNDPSILKLGPAGKRGPENRTTPSRPQPRGDFRRDSSRMQRVYRDRDGGYRPNNNRYGGRQNRGYRNNYDAPRYNNRRAPRRDRDPRPQRRRNDDRDRDRVKRANPGDAKYLAVRDAPKEEGFKEDFDFKAATFSKEEALKQAPEKAPQETGAEEAKEESVASKEEAPVEQGDAEKSAEATEANTSEEAPKQEETVEQEEQDDKKEASPEPKPEKPQLKYTYNKATSFFDDLDLVDKAHMDFRARRKIDAQTFGSEAENYKVRRRRRRGGRRRRNNYY